VQTHAERFVVVGAFAVELEGIESVEMERADFDTAAK
jgi:hypothetical protein